MTLALSITLNVNSTWASKSFFLRPFKNVICLIVTQSREYIASISWLKAWLPMVVLIPLKMATTVYKRKIGIATEVKSSAKWDAITDIFLCRFFALIKS